MMQKMYSRGFTLIELLVVIAIIGILASVVLASLNNARDKGQDATIQSNVNSARAEAELAGNQTDGTVDYTGICTDELATLVTAVENADGNQATDADCQSDADEWVFGGNLVSSTTIAWCSDSTGFAGQIAAVDNSNAAEADGAINCTNLN